MVRAATVKDIDIIYELAHVIWPQTYQPILKGAQIDYMLGLMYSKETLKELIESGGQDFFIAFEDEKPIGFMSISVKAERPVKIFKLNKLYLLPDTQGKGYGKIMVDFINGYIKALGAKILELNVNRKNKALAFYQRLGFNIYKEEDIPIGEDYLMEDFVMRKKVI